ncbi:MAG: hypothetical protein K8S56_09720 [Candidatus Cloacimonetes bacterium]|nr:hypothetical protein [Candidatus Cloacimonadota bacterium]
MKMFEKLNQRQMEFVVSNMPEFTKIVIKKSKNPTAEGRYDVGIKDKKLFSYIKANLTRFDRKIFINTAMNG